MRPVQAKRPTVSRAETLPIRSGVGSNVPAGVGGADGAGQRSDLQQLGQIPTFDLDSDDDDDDDNDDEETTADETDLLGLFGGGGGGIQDRPLRLTIGTGGCRMVAVQRRCRIEGRTECERVLQGCRERSSSTTKDRSRFVGTSLDLDGLSGYEPYPAGGAGAASRQQQQVQVRSSSSWRQQQEVGRVETHQEQQRWISRPDLLGLGKRWQRQQRQQLLREQQY